MFAVFVSGSGVDGFYSILAVSGFYRFARVRAAFAFLLPCAACQVTGLLGALWLFKMCPVFLSDKSGLRF